MSQKITGFEGKGIPLRGNDIDTDRIIPARFMKCVTFIGLGKYAFHDERMDPQGQSKGHPFDDQRWRGHPVLVVNGNFGCGSSREHAPQALKDFGIQAIIGESFAEIFTGNCISLGIPAVSLDAGDVKELQDLLEKSPGILVSVELESMSVSAEGRSWRASMPPASRNALRDGSWDSTTVLLAAGDAIEKTAENLPYLQ